MRSTVVVLGALYLVACNKAGETDRSGQGNMMAASDSPTAVEEIRVVMLEQRPGAAETINALRIRNDKGAVTLSGRVDDEQMKRALLDRVRTMPGVKEVKDELMVAPPSTAAASTSTPTTDAVRAAMNKEHPQATTVIQRLVISDDGTIVYLTGTVPDQSTHDALVKSASAHSGGKKVKDNLQVGR